MSKRKGETAEEYKARQREYKKAHYATNKDKIRATDRARFAALSPEARKARHAADRAHKNARIEEIWGRPIPASCELCGGKNTSHARGSQIYSDHDHQTCEPRLFLCNRCNFLEGFIKTDWSRIIGLFAYHLWREGCRGEISLPVQIRGSYPTSPPLTPEGRRWIETHIERTARAKRIQAQRNSGVQ